MSVILVGETLLSRSPSIARQECLAYPNGARQECAAQQNLTKPHSGDEGNRTLPRLYAKQPRRPWYVRPRSTAYGTRTRVARVRTWHPWPLDERGNSTVLSPGVEPGRQKASVSQTDGSTKFPH